MQKYLYALCSIIVLILCAPLQAKTITGRVIGPDAAPVVATIFQASSFPDTVKSQAVQTETDGSFQLEIATPAENPEVKKRARGGIEESVLAAYAPELGLATAVVNEAGETIVKFAPNEILSDVIRDDKGAPAVGATVRVERFYQRLKNSDSFQYLSFSVPAAFAPHFSAQSDATGQWQIKGIPADADVVVMLDDDNYVPDIAQYGAKSGMGGAVVRKLKAQRAGAISGRVLDKNGEPAAEISLVAVQQRTGLTSDEDVVSAQVTGLAKSDAEGIFRFKRLPPGTYALLLNDPGLWFQERTEAKPAQFAAPAIEDVRVEAGATVANFKLQLAEVARVTGRIVDRDTGKPLSGAAVGAFGAGAPRSLGNLPATYTDSEGRYELAVVPGDNAIYAYEQNRFGSEKLTKLDTVPLRLQAGQSATREVKIERRYVDVQGQVVNENGTPLPDVEITLWNTSGTGQFLHSDENGNFLVNDNRKGALRLAPRAQWSVISPKKVIVPLPAGETLKIVLKANAMAKTSGRIVDGAGAPIKGVKVRFTMPLLDTEHAGSRSVLSGESDEKGVYVLGELKMPEALQLLNENVNKEGYKLRDGGGKVPATANAKSPMLQLSDIVMEQLNRTIKGKVTTRDGQAVAGALVRASGDDYRSSVTTNAQGEFSLDKQATGKIELLAAHQRAFGRTLLEGDKSDVTIVLEAGAPIPAQDAKRAGILFREMAPALDKYTLNDVTKLLAPQDPAAALQLLLSVPKADATTARKQVFDALDASSSETALAWARDEVANFDKDRDFIEAAARLGLLWETRDKQVAGDWFDEAQARRERMTGEGKAEATAWLAALATRLDLPVAEALSAQIFGGAGQAPLTLQPPLVALASGSAALAERVLRGLAPEKTDTINQYKTAIETVAPYDARGALRLLEQMRELVDAVRDLPDENGQFRGRNVWEFTWAFAAKDVLRNLDRSDAETAAEVARRVKLWHRTSALALAAEFGSKEQRLAMVEETLAAETRGDWMKNITAPRLGALTAELDPTLAASFFTYTAQALETQRIKHNSASYTDWSFYAAFWNPAQARMTLEAEWQRNLKAKLTPSDKEFRSNDWSQASLAMAMSSVDIDRAIAMARQISHQATPNNESPRTRALSFIGRFLLTPPDQRRLMVVGFESGYDS